MLTLREIRHRIVDIRRLAKEADNERAHVEEDRLHRDVLEAIAGGEFDELAEAAEVARLALWTQRIRFERWYA